ncbi:MAG: NADH-ubiquinone oxidoreductase-F iron-sulfur binding region domain-containing protein [Bacteroidota bacterium]|jgi:NADH:ubiquinone oxidoreductase subunit F (NADH-binding)/NADH:ubiquinone oxidoreductase subunit E
MSKNLSELSGRKGLEQNLFEEIGILARKTGTPSVEELEKLADAFLIGKANTYGAASFYDFTRPENQGKKVYVCDGSACMTAGTQEALKAKLGEHYEASEIGSMYCLGRCHENKAFHANGYNYSGSDIERIDEIKKGNRRPLDKYNTGSHGTPVLMEPTGDVDAFYTLWRNALQQAPEQLLEEVKKSGIRGRGGAGFPMGIKLETCKNTPSNVKFVVCNADEGDPGAYSDRFLMEERPHALLLGMMLTGYMIGASWGVVYIRGEYPESIDVIEDCIRELYAKGLLGENILGSGFNFQFKVIRAMGAYICGEETALLNSIEGQRPEVRVRPPFPAQSGLFNKPTVVNNVETLASVPWILREGGARYASIGRGRSTGTKLISLDGHFHKPGIYEADMGTPLEFVVNELGGGFTNDIKAMHIGGPLGGMVPVSKIKDLSLDFESFQQAGFLLGHASVVCIPSDYPLVKYIEHLFEFTAHESCGKCFPCRLGSTRGKEMFQKAIEEGYKIDRKLLDDLLNTMEIGSLCALGGGLPLPVKNILQYFEPELKEYLQA